MYRVEVYPGKLTYGGELITNSDNLGSNASVTVFDEFDRDFAFVSRELSEIRELEAKKSLTAPQNLVSIDAQHAASKWRVKGGGIKIYFCLILFRTCEFYTSLK